MKNNTLLKDLNKKLKGDVLIDKITTTIYSTDASDYKEKPIGVCFPKNEKDIQEIVKFGIENNINIIPRSAGTSLAGQVVGNGLIMDVSKYMNQILEINVEKRWARVQPGVVRDELNLALKKYGLLFGPETATANRATIGGMMGNNSCGANSIVYGSTREHLLEVKAILSDYSLANFKEIDLDEINKKIQIKNLEGKIYQEMLEMLSPIEVQEEIHKEFPKPSIKRRNTGYALDMLLHLKPFNKNGNNFNFCQLLAGSEGTLAFVSELKVNLELLPPNENALLCIHFNSIHESLIANIECIKYNPYSCELIDHYILDCTKNNIEYKPYTFFVEGSPKAIIVVEFRGETQEIVMNKINELKINLQNNKMGYHYSIVDKKDVSKVWGLRKAGLGLLANLPGDEKAVAVIEDTAVDVIDQANYIKDFNEMLNKYGLYSVHYAHIGTGELHLRPLINLKSKKGQETYRAVAEETAKLVKKYKGSLSGEHGDGRLRGEFIEFMFGKKNYDLFLKTKNIWDSKNILNPNKIVNTPKMDESLRYKVDYPYPIYDTYFRYKQGDWLREIQQCNGSGDCRKSHLSGGTMCPSFMATKDEQLTTRARANMLRETLSNTNKLEALNSKEVYKILDLCLSCKGCKSECPSNVDMAKFKAEFLQHYYINNKPSFRTKIFANFSSTMKLASKLPLAYNFFNQTPILKNVVKYFLGFANNRSVPILSNITLYKWFINYKKEIKHKISYHSKVYLFCDEFTNYLDVEIGKKSILLLEKLGYDVIIPEHLESGRSFLSKGFLKQAKIIANKNVEILSKIINENIPLIGIEPSTILTFRDEYPDLVDNEFIQKSKNLSKNVFLIDEFLVREFNKGKINKNQFNNISKNILLHGHCQQKAVANLQNTILMLQISNNNVKTIPSGCCGMAGSFGYEKEHYKLSMNVGEMVLFPTIRNANKDEIIVAFGTSCRHQIKDGTKVISYHPVEILLEQLL